MVNLNVTFLLIASSILAIIHIIALELFLYWRFFWLDIPMHFLGGAVVALAVFAGHSLGLPIKKRYLHIIPVLSFVIIIALLWEIFGSYIDVQVEEDLLFDTILDVIMGIIGGLVGYIVATRVTSLES